MLVIGWWLLPITLFHLVPLSLQRPLMARAVAGFQAARMSSASSGSAGSANPSIRSCRSPGWAATSRARGSPISAAFRARRRRPAWSSTSRSEWRPSSFSSWPGWRCWRPDRATHAAVLVASGGVDRHRRVRRSRSRHSCWSSIEACSSGSPNWLRRVAPEKWLSGFAGGASAIDDAVVATYRRGFALSRANLLRLAGVGRRRRRDLVGDAFPGPAVRRDRRLCPRKPRLRRRARRRSWCPERWALSRAALSCSGRCSDCRPSGAGHFPVETGSRAGSRAAGPRGLAVGRRASSLRRRATIGRT